MQSNPIFIVKTQLTADITQLSNKVMKI